MFGIFMEEQPGGGNVKITEIYNDVINENLDHEFKAELNPENPMKWAKTIVGYANGKGGVMFVGVSNEGEAFGLNLEEIDKTKNLVARINDRSIFPHARVQYSMRSVDDKAEHFVLGIHVLQADSILRYREGDYNEKVFTKGDEIMDAVNKHQKIYAGDPVCEYFLKKREEGKPYRVAMFAAYNKFLRIYHSRVSALLNETEA
jgi:hypothetical protein